MSNLTVWLITLAGWALALGAGVWSVVKGKGIVKWFGGFGVLVALGFAGLFVVAANHAAKRQRLTNRAEAERMVSEVMLACALGKPVVLGHQCELRIYAEANRRNMDRDDVDAGLASVRARAAGAVLTQQEGR